MKLFDLRGRALALVLLGIAVLVAGIANFVATGPADAAHFKPATLQPVRPYWVDRPCPAEDSNNCYWDAEVRGDGQGRSYITRQLPGGRICVFYTKQAYQDDDYCFKP